MLFFYHFGRYLLFLKNMFSKPERFRVYFDRTMIEMNDVGVGSLGIITIISLFIGGVTTLQIAYQLVSGFIAPSVIGQIVSDSTFLEFAPTISGLVLAGKVGSKMASELGTMRVTEQIDAIEVMGVNSAGLLVMPKIVAAVFMIPCLTIIAILLSIWGGVMVGDLTGILSTDQFIQGARSTFKPFTLFFSLTKSFVFAFIISSISSFQGYYTQGGALEVGRASTKAVVYSSVLLLFADYLLAQMLL